MKKHLFSSLGLALMMLIWGGEAKAQLQLQEAANINYDNDKAEYIPAGWTVSNEGHIRPGGTNSSSWNENFDAGVGPRLFTFTNTTLFKNALYLRTNSETMSYALYGDLDGYELYLPEGYVEVTVPALGWGSKGSLQVDVLKYEADKSVDELTTVASTTQQVTIQISGASSEVTAVDEITVGFQNAEKARYVVKCSTTASGNGFAIAGLTVNYDPLAVFVETFAGTPDSYTPAVGSGWNVYYDNDGTVAVKDKGGDYSSGIKGSRVFKLASTVLPYAMYHESYWANPRAYEVYGEADEEGVEPTLTLEEGVYTISFDAAIWAGDPAIMAYLLDANGKEIASVQQTLTATSGSKTADFTPESVSFSATIESAGNYKLKFTASNRVLYGNIAIRKDLSTALVETFTGLSHAVPSTGWIFYNNGSAVKQGSTVYGGARVFGISGNDAITNVAYLGWQGTCYLTYGEENSGKSLTLVGGQEYRITYYAANWDGNTESTRTMACEITGADGQGTAFSRTDVLSGLCNNNAWNAAFKTNPDFIQATFTPEKSGNYILKFTGLNAMVANISIKENSDEGIVFETSLDKFGYTSLYLDQAVGLPSDVKAYIGKLNETADAIVLTELEGEVIPANTGVILIGEANAALTFYPTESEVVAPEDNILQGVVVGTKAPYSDAYVLGYKTTDEAPAFYKNTTKTIKATIVTTIDEAANLATINTTYDITEGSATSVDYATATGEWKTTTTVKDSEGNETTEETINYTAGTETKDYEYVQVIRANKAYFVLPTTAEAAPSYRILFGEDTDEPGNVTAIEQIETAAPAARVIYDLSGRRLTDMSKSGLYIVNGRKMLVK